MVRLTSANSTVFKNVKSAGGNDIRFTYDNVDGSHTDSASFEIERFDQAHTVAEFWVMIPTVNAAPATTSFRMYFGNASATGTNPSNPPSVFYSAMPTLGGVWHFGANNTWNDATGNGNTAVNGGTGGSSGQTSLGEGVTGPCRLFNSGTPGWDSIKVANVFG